MLYAVLDDNAADGTQIATTRGWGDFLRWVYATPPGRAPLLTHLADWGWSGNLPGLEQELRTNLASNPPKDEDTLDVARGLADLVQLGRTDLGAEILSVGTGVLHDGPTANLSYELPEEEQDIGLCGNCRNPLHPGPCRGQKRGGTAAERTRASFEARATKTGGSSPSPRTHRTARLASAKARIVDFKAKAAVSRTRAEAVNWTRAAHAMEYAAIYHAHKKPDKAAEKEAEAAKFAKLAEEAKGKKGRRSFRSHKLNRVTRPVGNQESLAEGTTPEKAAEWLSSQEGAMPGYGQVFTRQADGVSQVWYVGGDGDTKEFYELVKSTLGRFGEVTYEAEAFPPKAEGWLRVYPPPTANSEYGPVAVANYNPAQPRHPAGSSLGGQFASSGGGTGGGLQADKGGKPGSATTPSGGGGRGISAEPRTAPPPGPSYNPRVEHDDDGDGVTDHARVGVAGRSVPPPPPIGRLPNLTPHERKVEDDFIRAYEADPDGTARRFREIVSASAKPGEPPTYGTDDAKVLTDAWTHPDQSVRSQNRATLNLALHQTANAIAKRAFIHELDELTEGDEIMVTVGGCGAGKGYALKNVPDALAMKGRAKVVWDSAGDQNATENPWILEEAQKRGLRVNYVYVHADPKTQWAHPERGVVKRAADPNDGRMVDAQVFADSYVLGARNHHNFYEANKDNPAASFIFLENRGKPQRINGVPKEVIDMDREELAHFAMEVVKTTDAPPHVKRGALMGERIWGAPKPGHKKAS